MTMQSPLANFTKNLGEGLVLKVMEEADFARQWNQHYPVVFQANTRLDVRAMLSDIERQQMQTLASYMGSPLCLRFGLFQGDEFVGWHVGDQRSPDEFYMRNSGVVPHMQGRGHYTKMLRAILIELQALGFQVISSKHNATNNRVIIPKLKAGFVITGLELSDKFGTLVRLEYFTNRTRRAIMDYRCGQLQPTDEIKRLIGL
jgi:RimJ/RimL family protein N-acetyltransferase